jgi:hypothetical protein
MPSPAFTQARDDFHDELRRNLLSIDQNQVPSNADKDSYASVEIARRIAAYLGVTAQRDRLSAQTLGSKFEAACTGFIRSTFMQLGHLRPGKWEVRHIGSRSRLEIASYEQYAHLKDLDEATKGNPALKAILGSDYTIAPDVVIIRALEEDAQINSDSFLVDEQVARRASLRKINGGFPLLHASISCKWTIRSDRSQNSRSEALNLVRNRKGHLPHIVVVTAEPTPSRLASIALGTGDIDCVYHYALPELERAVEDLGPKHSDSQELLKIMVEGKRLKDIADLPLDLAV